MTEKLALKTVFGKDIKVGDVMCGYTAPDKVNSLFTVLDVAKPFHGAMSRRIRVHVDWRRSNADGTTAFLEADGIIKTFIDTDMTYLLVVQEPLFADMLVEDPR